MPTPEPRLGDKPVMPPRPTSQRPPPPVGPGPDPLLSRSPLASTAFSPGNGPDQRRGDTEQRPKFVSPTVDEPSGIVGPMEDEESTRAVSRDELLRPQAGHVVVGDDAGADGDDATLAVGPSDNEANNLRAAGLARMPHDDVFGAPPPVPLSPAPHAAFQMPGMHGKPDAMPAPQPNRAPQWGEPQQPPQWGEPQAPPQWGDRQQPPHWGEPQQPQAPPQWGEPQPKRASQWGEPQQPPQWGEPQQGRLPNAGVPMHGGPQGNDRPMANMSGGMIQGPGPMGAMPPMHGMPASMSYPGQPAGSISHSQPVMAWAPPQPEGKRFKVSGQIILLAVVGVICLTIFITGIVLFATTKF